MRTFNRAYRGRHRFRTTLVTILAAVVVFTTTYALVLPAITIDDQTAEEEPGLTLEEPVTSEAVQIGVPAEPETIEEATEAPAAETSADAETADVEVETEPESVTEPESDAEEAADPEAGVTTENEEGLAESSEDPEEEPVAEPASSEESDAEEGLTDETVEETGDAEEEESGEEETGDVEAGETADEESADEEVADEETDPEEEDPAAEEADGQAPAEEKTKGEDAEKNAEKDAEKDEEKADEAEEVKLPAMAFQAEMKKSQVTAAGQELTAELQTARAEAAEQKREAEARGEKEAQRYVIVDVEAEEGTFPAGTTMTVKAIRDQSVLDTITEKVEENTDSSCEVSSVVAFDITFRDTEGNEIEPNKPIRVTMSGLEVPEAATEAAPAESVVVHVDKEGEAQVVEQADDAETTSDEVAFDAEHFSVYAVVYTVDFHWDVDGETFESSITGGSFVSFTELVRVLGIANTDAPEDIRKFVENVESITFSDPELLAVSKVEEDMTIAEIKEDLGLVCEYSAELTEEQIAEINAQTVTAGDWALISLKPFDTEEALTVTMKNGEVFQVRVTDVAYQGTKVTDPNGKTVALLNLRNNPTHALQSTAHATWGRLQANKIQLNGNRITSVDPISTWTFTQVPGTTDRYYIQADTGGYLNIVPAQSGDDGTIFVTNQPQALTVQQKSDGTIRIKHADNDFAVNNFGNVMEQGYSAYRSTWNDNPGEWFTMYEVGEPVVPHVTVHYVDRNGNPLTDVNYTGTNPLVVQNADGTFTIPYDWGSGQTTDTSVDLRAQFTKAGWTYANTHLAGRDASGDELTYEGYVIDAVLTRSGSNLQFKTDSGETTPPPFGQSYVMGNHAYGTLSSFSLSDRITTRPTDNGDRLPYAISENKDIYVILDPPTQYSSTGVPSGETPTIDEPSFNKTMDPNDDGTYTLALTVKPHAKNVGEDNRANVLFIVDTSSSMHRTTTSDRRNRIMDTHDAVREFGDKLLAYNEEHPNSVEVAMITFDGGVDERLDWTDDKSLFDTRIDNYLRYYYLHTGTDWEDGMRAGLEKILTDTDDDPTFVVFFTDGEPSQYNNFHGPGTNGNADPTGTHTGSTDPGTGYPNFYSYFLSRESSKDEMRAVVNADVSLYGIYAYNQTNEAYNGYNGPEDGALMLHNAIRYGYDTTQDLTDNRFFEARNTNDVKKAFDKVFNSITEAVGLTNLVVSDGIAAGVTSSEVVDGDVSGFTYIIKKKDGSLDYKVTVAPHDAPEGTEEGKPIFWIGGDNDPHVGEIRSVPTKKVRTNSDGTPVKDPTTGNILTETVNVEVYYYLDPETGRKYIMPIATTGEDVSWDLSPLGILQDGYTYEVNFVVWPNQEAYDLVADLNNGKRTDLEEHWEDKPVLRDKDGKAYRKGGIVGYPYISRYDATENSPAIYAALSNTEQTMEYYIVDEKTVNGEPVEIITGPIKDPIDPPDPMPLTSARSKLEKVWNVDRDPNVLYELLYGGDEPLIMSFDIRQDNKTAVYKTVQLGWKANEDPEDIWDGEYVWEPDSPTQTIVHDEETYEIGTHWAADFAIATGLMLSEERMDELGLNKGAYPHGTFKGTTYYVLEEGHDYTISEPQLSYEFDFVAPTYHPMLVDGVLQSVNFTAVDDDTVDITAMTDNEDGLSALQIQNTLRGYINLDKIVVDIDRETVMASDDTKFYYTITLNNANGPFDGDHIPWFGINGLFYHDEDGNYYQAQVRDGQLTLRTESSGPYPAVCENFNPNEVGAQTISYVDDDGQPQSVVIYGNRMTMSNEQKTVSATLHITQGQTLNIANVPIYTTYTITENAQEGYELIKIVKEIKKNENDANPESSETITEVADRSISGTIVPDRDNHLVFYNLAQRGGLKIHKRVVYNGRESDERASVKEHLKGTYTFTIYKDAACTDPYLEEGEPKTISLTIDDTLASVTSAEVEGLPAGNYWIKEETEGHDALPWLNPVKVTVKAGKTGDNAIVANFTNDYSDGEDEAYVSVQKTFSGLTEAEFPEDFKVTLTNGSETHTLIYGGGVLADGVTADENVLWIDTEDDFVWQWKIMNVSAGTTYTVVEENEDVAGYTVTTTGTGEGQTIQLPEIDFSLIGEIQNNCNEADWPVNDGTIFVSSVTSAQGGHKGTLVISKQHLSMGMRKAIEKSIADDSAFNGSWNGKFYYYSVDEHPNGFSINGSSVEYNTETGMIHFGDTEIWKHVASVSVSIAADHADFAITNDYEAIPVPLEIVKIESETEIKLPNATFTITLLNEEDGRPKNKLKDGSETEYELVYTEDKETDTNGKILFEGLAPGIYEIKESDPPSGYVLTSDAAFYIRVSGGAVHWVNKVEHDGVITWVEKEEGTEGLVTFTAATAGDPVSGEGAANATFTVENYPGAALPHTGGRGTKPYQLGGAILVASSALIYLFRMRRRERRYR